MKRILFVMVALLTFMGASAQSAAEARKVLDKTASVVGNKKGAQASFQLSGTKMKASGTIAIKGNKFYAKTGQGTVWFNGKTQWAYMTNTDEVNITTPTQAQQMAMNPLTFINMYKSGYTLSMKTVSGSYEVRMVAQNANNSVQEMYIVINKSTYVPTQVRMRQKSGWTSINISNFKAAAQADATFVFNQKNYPTAEIVDLR